MENNINNKNNQTGRIPLKNQRKFQEREIKEQSRSSNFQSRMDRIDKFLSGNSKQTADNRSGQKAHNVKIVQNQNAKIPNKTNNLSNIQNQANKSNNARNYSNLNKQTSKIQQNVNISTQRPSQTKVVNVTKAKQGEKLKISFLGGVGEIGKNMTVLEFGNEIIIIDAGLSFPSDEMPGIDIVIPDYAYLVENANKIKGLVITHGHEDHIGAVPYLLKDLPNVDLFGSKLTLAILDNKFREKNMNNVKAHVVEPRDVVKMGNNFAVEFVHVNHSIAGAMALSISTPVGTIFHTGDFKIDFEPIDGQMIDLPRIAEIGRQGVLLMLGESTNVEREGYTESESRIGEKLRDVFEANMKKRLFVATFSSNIYRVQQILELAEEFKRKVVIMGRSMLNNIDAGNRIGCFRFSKDLFTDIEHASKMEGKNVLILCTGSQGEPTAALSRLANGSLNKVEIGNNDCIILSSSPIPGNETNVNRVINNLYRKGAEVIHENVHTSGHACIEEIKTIHSLLKPKFFIPVHGEYRHLKKHADLAENMGMPEQNILVVENGMSVSVGQESMLISGKVQAGERLVDGLGIGETDSVVLRDRKLLSEDGMAIVVISVSEASGELLGDPFLITRGFVYTGEAEKLGEEAKAVLMETLKGIDFKQEKDFSELRNVIRKPLRNFFYKATQRNPMILPIIIKS